MICVNLPERALEYQLAPKSSDRMVGAQPTQRMSGSLRGTGFGEAFG